MLSTRWLMTDGRASVWRSGGTRRRKRCRAPSRIGSPLTVAATLLALTAGVGTFSTDLADVGTPGAWADAAQARPPRHRLASQGRKENRMVLGLLVPKRKWTGQRD